MIKIHDMITNKEKDFNFRITVALKRSDILKALKAKGANVEYLEELLAWMRRFEVGKSQIALDADVKEDEDYVGTLADIVSDYYELLQDKVEEVKEENVVCLEGDDGKENTDDSGNGNECKSEEKPLDDLVDILARFETFSTLAQEILASFVPDEKKK